MCNKCGDDINFTETSLRGLGFKLKMNWSKCETVLLKSWRLINVREYDVNRWLVFAFKFLGIGWAGTNKFLGVSTLISFYSVKVLYLIVKISYCKACEFSKTFEGTEEYNEWSNHHSGKCSIAKSQLEKWKWIVL